MPARPSPWKNATVSQTDSTTGLPPKIDASEAAMLSKRRKTSSAGVD